MTKSRKEVMLALVGVLCLPIFLGFFFVILRLFSPDVMKFPTVYEIYKDFISSLLDLDVLSAFVSTGKNVFTSVILSILFGVGLSFLLNLNKWIWAAVEPTIDFLRSVPITFFIPAFALILGILSPNIIWVLAVIPSTLIILVNVSLGIKELESSEKQNRLHHYRLISGKENKWSSFIKVKVYEMFPHFMSGFKVALSYAIVIVTVLEYMQMGNQIGLGKLVYNEMEQLNHVRVYSIIIIVGLVGYLLNLVIQNANNIYKFFLSLFKTSRFNENR